MTARSLAMLSWLAFTAGCAAQVGDGPEARESGLRRGVLVWDGERIPVPYDLWNGRAVWQQDIVPGRFLEPGEGPAARDDSGRETQPLHASDRAEHRWPNGVVPYVIDGSLPAAERVHDAIAHWEAHTDLVFVRRRGEPAYVRFVRADEGCRAMLGHQGDEQFVWLGDACGVGAAIHEIGHAVGLHHEHVRRDRDDHIRVYWDNIEPDMREWFEVVEGGRLLGGYDTHSIMHYHSHAASRNGRPTMLRHDGSEIEYARLLSAGDRAGIGALYREERGCPQVVRWAGPDRFATAAAISRGSHDAADHAVLVSGADDAQVDALSSGPLAHERGGPVLLTTRDAVPEQTLAELERLGVRTVSIVGGTAVVSDAVEAQLRGQGYGVERVAGASRFGTAAQVARQMGSSSHAFVVSGFALVDAVAASAAGARLGWPVLLVTRDAVPAETREALADLGIRRTVVVGGSSVVSEAVATELPDPVRLAGADRYETALQVARFVDDRDGAADVLLARGDLIVDGVVGGAVGDPVLLTPPRRLSSSAADYLLERGADRVAILGGGGAVSASAANQSCHYLDMR